MWDAKLILLTRIDVTIHLPGLVQTLQYKVVAWAKLHVVLCAYRLSEMILPYKCFPNVSKMALLTYN